MGDYNKPIQFLKSIDMYKTLEEKRQIAERLFNLSETYYNKADYKESLEHLSEAKVILKK